VIQILSLYGNILVTNNNLNGAKLMQYLKTAYAFADANLTAPDVFRPAVKP
jgi:hypothetical protein